MSTTVRAKFSVVSETKHSWNPEAKTYKFQALYDPNLPEDRRFSKATPSGSLEMQVDNPNVSFELGKAYYLDFTPADE